MRSDGFGIAGQQQYQIVRFAVAAQFLHFAFQFEHAAHFPTSGIIHDCGAEVAASTTRKQTALLSFDLLRFLVVKVEEANGRSEIPRLNPNNFKNKIVTDQSKAASEMKRTGIFK